MGKEAKAKEFSPPGILRSKILREAKKACPAREAFNVRPIFVSRRRYKNESTRVVRPILPAGTSPRFS